MALIRRISRLMRADLHAVLDQLEEPDILLRQAVREMEEILAKDQQRYKLQLHEQELLEAREKEITQSLADSESELDLCFENSQEALARNLIKRRLEAANILKVLTGRRSRLENSCTELKTSIEQNRSRLESTRQKAELLSEEQPQEAPGECWPEADARIRDHEVELELLRERQKRGLS